MTELRETIAREIEKHMYLRDPKIAASIADRILSLPEIAEVLLAKQAMDKNAP